MKRVDFKNDPRFKELARRKEAAEKPFTVFKKAMRISWPNANDAYVKAIGSNISLLVIVPFRNDDGSFVSNHMGCHFRVCWAATGSEVNDTIKNAVLSALVLCADDEIEKVREVSSVQMAIDAIVEHRGKSYFEDLGPTLVGDVQGVRNDKIRNPYHRKQ